MGFYDNSGRIHFVRRLKDVIKCMDNQVAPAELEDILLRCHEGIADVAVVGLPHPEYGEAAAAFILPKDDPGTRADISAREVKRLIAGKASSAVWPLFVGVRQLLTAVVVSARVWKCNDFDTRSTYHLRYEGLVSAVLGELVISHAVRTLRG